MQHVDPSWLYWRGGGETWVEVFAVPNVVDGGKDSPCVSDWVTVEFECAIGKEVLECKAVVMSGVNLKKDGDVVALGNFLEDAEFAYGGGFA